MIARVALDLALRKEFDYLVPPELSGLIEVGSRVKVPFGPRQLLGSVTSLLDASPHANLRPISKVIEGEAPLTPKLLKLARWIAEYYCCSLELTLKSVLPEVVRKEKAGWKQTLHVRKTAPGAEPPKLTKRQQAIWDLLREVDEISLQELLAKANTTATTLRRLEELHLIEIAPKITERDPYAREIIMPTDPLPLHAEQARALEKINLALDASQRGEAVKPFLLHGVTGSGKTEVYLQAIAHSLEQGRGAIVLVPEISLTPQTVERFKARFSGGNTATLVAVLHSHLSAGERHDEWQKIRKGRARIVIGARSAVFAPVDPLGLVIVDEEHESSYKQEESPRYHARDVAVMRAHLEKAVVTLGSATPSLETYYNATKGKYELLEMPTRADDKKLPLIRVIDMCMEGKIEKAAPIFSGKLVEAIRQRLERKEQVMLFLNRRGYAASLQCPKCGYVAGCPHCSIALTYHRKAQQLLCHICGHRQEAPLHCPEVKCRNPQIRFAGVGTERVEEALGKIFPHARAARMDSDLMKRKEDYRIVLGDFKRGKLDILLGTQMIAKGLHFPNVTLVGIIYADLSLHMPDFRAGERTFQLLTQVSGRAGRGDVEGEVIVQSFTPFHYAIQYARRQDYAGFAEAELEFRLELNYPPASRLALLLLKGRNEDKVRLSADYLREEVEKATVDLPGLAIAGPAPAPLLKAETFYRYQLMLRSTQMPKLSAKMAALLRDIKLPEDISLTVDIDPVNIV